MKLRFKLEPICTKNGSGLKLWGYEVLLRNPIPNPILFAVENPPLDIFVFESALDFLQKNGRQGLRYTVNIQPSTLRTFGQEIKESIIQISDRLEVFVELTETGGSVPRSVLSGIKIILDDFGNVESNLYRLLAYDPFGIKLEIDLIESSRRKDLTWIINMIENLKSNGKIIIGEKIETQDQLLIAREMGISHYQGKIIEEMLTNSYHL